MSKLIRVLGIDASMRNFGLVRATIDLETSEIRPEEIFLVETENETTKQVRKNSDDLRRAKILSKGLHSAAKGCVLGIVEMPVGSQSARAMASYGMTVGVLAGSPIPLIEVTPFQVKEVATGDKNATKDEMIQWAAAKYPYLAWHTYKKKGVTELAAKNEHLADATAAIHAGILTGQFLEAVALMKGMVV